MKLGPELDGATFNAAQVDYLGVGAGFCLRPSRPDGSYDPNALLPASAIVVLPSMVATGLSELWGFEEIAAYPLAPTGEMLGSIGWRISQQGGAGGTYYYWNGSAWAIASDDELHWCTALDMDLHLHELPLHASKSPRLAFRMTPDASRRYSPRLAQPWFLCEVVHRGESSVEEALRAFMVEHGSFPLRLDYTPKAATSSIPIKGSRPEFDKTPFDIEAVTAVYDLTDDPAESQSLFDAYVAGRADLTAPIEAAHVARVHYLGRCDTNISVGIAEDQLFESQVPAIGALTPSVEERRDIDPADHVEVSWGRRIAKRRAAPIVKELTFNIFVQGDAGDGPAVNSMCRVLFEAFEQRPLVFPPTGETLGVFPLQQFQAEDSIRQGLLVRRCAIRVLFFDWPMTSTAVPFADAVRIVLDGAGGGGEVEVIE